MLSKSSKEQWNQKHILIYSYLLKSFLFLYHLSQAFISLQNPNLNTKKLDSNFLDKNNNNSYTYSLYEKYKKIKFENTTCNILAPIKIFGDQLKNTPIKICNEKNTKH